jgi:inhibitor of cysteine peptidase
MGEIALSAADTGKTCHVRVGDVILVSLLESPTSGYRWDVDELTPSLDRLGDEFVAEPGSRLGGDGTRTFRFEAREPGTGGIALKRWRAWEGESSVRERFDATIHVRF